MRILLSGGLLLLAIGFGWWRGGAPERLFAAILAAIFVLDRIGHALFAGHPSDIANLHLVIDFAALPAIAVIAIEARRFWPIFALSLQLLSASSHVGRFLDQASIQLPVTIGSIVPFPAMCMTLVVGTFAHARRLRRRGYDPSWRRSSARATKKRG